MPLVVDLPILADGSNPKFSEHEAEAAITTSFIPSTLSQSNSALL